MFCIRILILCSQIAFGSLLNVGKTLGLDCYSEDSLNFQRYINCLQKKKKKLEKLEKTLKFRICLSNQRWTP